MNTNTNKNIAKFLLISLLFTIAFIIFQCVNDDFLTHTSRLYNLAISFHNGEYNPYMYQSCCYKYGYPFGIFYPDTFLKPFSMLIVLGLNIYLSFCIMLISINFATLLIPYLLLQRTKWKEDAFLISMFYFLYPYRFIDFAIRFSIGELMFFVFFPFIIYGLYKIFEEKKFSYGLFFGFWGIVHSHILSILFLLIFLIVFYIYKFNKLDKKIIKYTLINAGWVLITCMDVYLPIIEAQIKENLEYESNPAFMGELLENTRYIMKPNIIVSILIIIFIIGLIYIVIKNDNKYLNCSISILILLIMNTNLFPWNWFPFLNIIQFPFRLFVFGCIPWVILSIDLHKTTKKYSSIKLLQVIFIIELILTFVFAYIYEDYDYNEMYANIGAGDYVNEEAYNLEFWYENPNRDSNILTNHYYVENGYIPVLYYSQYHVWKDETELDYENRKGILYVEGLDKEWVKVIFHPTFIQKISYLISVLFLFIFIVNFLYNKKEE